jgi:hypothetical protein
MNVFDQSVPGKQLKLKIVKERRTLKKQKNCNSYANDLI